MHNVNVLMICRLHSHMANLIERKQYLNKLLGYKNQEAKLKNRKAEK